MILDKIKSATFVAHKNLETSPLLSPISDDSLDREAYQKILIKFYGFFYPLEQLVQDYEKLNAFLPDIDERRKAVLLKDDLCFLNYEGVEIPICQDLPTITSLSQAFGCLYVMEGSTLGGQYISRQVRKKLSLDNDNNKGTSFFSGYGKETSQKWKAFQEALVLYNQQSGDDEVILSAANETFFKLRKWFNS